MISLLLSFNLFLGVDKLGTYAFAGDDSVLVFCALDGLESFAAVAAFCRLASWQVCFFSLFLARLDTELLEFSNTDPALLGFARFTERLRLTSVSFDVTFEWLSCCGISQFWSLFYFRHFVWIAICFLFCTFFFLGFSFRLFSMWASSCVAFLRIFILQLTGVIFCLSDVAFSIECTSSCFHCVGSLWLHLVFIGFVSVHSFGFHPFSIGWVILARPLQICLQSETILPWIKEFLAQIRIECTRFIDNSP